MRWTRPMALAALALSPIAVAPAGAAAQDAPVRRQQPIEIRGQVPTPQVVTVRPREMPAYDRQVLVPTFYDRDFWQAILPGFRILPATALPSDSTAARGRIVPPSGADSVGGAARPAGTPPLRPATASPSGAGTPPASRAP